MRALDVAAPALAHVSAEPLNLFAVTPVTEAVTLMAGVVTAAQKTMMSALVVAFMLFCHLSSLGESTLAPQFR